MINKDTLTYGSLAYFDTGLYYDLQAFVADYLALITSEHASKPKFLAMMTTVLQPVVDLINNYFKILSSFDVDTAVGDQLDIIGQWVGISRVLTEPLEGVYFSFDTSGVGFDEGIWFNPFDPIAGLVTLDDDTYRVLIKAKIGANHWDGTIPGAYSYLDGLFSGYKVILQDNQDMSMLIGLYGSGAINAAILALLAKGKLTPKSAGVKVNGVMIPSVPSTRFFGFDSEGEAIGGFDNGSFAINL